MTSPPNSGSETGGEQDVAGDRGVFFGHEGYEGPRLLAQQDDEPRFHRAAERSDVDVVHRAIVALHFGPDAH